MDTLWQESAEARAAIEQVGGLEAALENPARLFELMGEIREASVDPRLAGWLDERHLTLAEVVDLVSTVATSEPDADLDTRSPGLRSKSARRAATVLYLRGTEPDVVGRILGVEPAHVEAYLSSRSAAASERAVVTQHFTGATVSQIASSTGLARMTVYAILERAGQEPNRGRSSVTPQQRDKIITLRREGKSYAEIREATKASTNQIKMTLRTAAAKGLLPEYGGKELVSA